MKHLVYTLLVLKAVSAISGQLPSDSSIHKLRKHIFNGYDESARPVRNPTDTTVVSVGLSPVHITELNENKGILTLEGWIDMTWRDDHLKWEPKNFSGIKVLRVPDKDVWKPDITIWDGRGSQVSPWTPVNVLVFNTGVVMWVPSASFQVICGVLDYSKYPRDTQRCKVTLGSWTNDAFTVNLKLSNDTVRLKDYKKSYNPHWQLIGATGERHENFYDCCGDTPYSSLVYQLTLKRRHVPFSSMTSTPDTAARILILCMFWVPNAIKKFLLGCTSLLILTSIASCVTSTLPSPAAASSAMSEVSSALALCISAMVVEVVVSAISSCSLPHPAFLDSVASSKVGLYLNPCGGNVLPDEKDSENPGQTQKISQWPLLGTLVDRAAFVVFAVLLLVI